MKSEEECESSSYGPSRKEEHRLHPHSWVGGARQARLGQGNREAAGVGIECAGPARLGWNSFRVKLLGRVSECINICREQQICRSTFVVYSVLGVCVGVGVLPA